MTNNDDITDMLTPRTREILLRYRQSKKRSPKAFLAANPDIALVDLVAVANEVLEITSSKLGAARTGRSRSRPEDAAPRDRRWKITLKDIKAPVWRGLRP